MVKVLLVCLGNICRSPMAEAVFRKMVEDEKLSDKIYIDSAATSNWEHGNPVHHGTRDRLANEGISVKGMTSRPWRMPIYPLTISSEWTTLTLKIFKDLLVTVQVEK